MWKGTGSLSVREDFATASLKALPSGTLVRLTCAEAKIHVKRSRRVRRRLRIDVDSITQAASGNGWWLGAIETP